MLFYGNLSVSSFLSSSLMSVLICSPYMMRVCQNAEIIFFLPWTKVFCCSWAFVTKKNKGIFGLFQSLDINGMQLPCWLKINCELRATYSLSRTAAFSIHFPVTYKLVATFSPLSKICLSNCAPPILGCKTQHYASIVRILL